MLREIRQVRQVRGEPRRRWFTSCALDLVVWLDQAGEMLAFQFCYDKGQAEWALSWSLAAGFSHLAVDDGEHGRGLGYKAAPILVTAELPEVSGIIDLFMQHGACLPPDIVLFVSAKIRAYCPHALI